MKTTRIFTILALALGLLLSAGEMALAGSIVGWGRNDEGQVDVPDGNDFVAIAAGWYHSLALKSDGSIVGWGLSVHGQVDVPGGNDFVAIAAGGGHSLALKSDDSIVGWGGLQSQVPGGNDFVAIAAGLDYSLALRSDGSIVGWGQLLQSEVPGGNDFVAIAAGGYDILALKSDGSIVGWRGGVPGGNDFVAIAAGGRDSLALRSDGSIVAWGRHLISQRDVPDGHNFVAIAAGDNHYLALKSDGSIVGWGENDYGQIDVPDGNDFVAIAARGDHSLALRATPPVSGFTYQGRLLDNNAAADGLYDVEFKLFDDAASGTQVGDTMTVHELDVIDGYFTVALDFPSDPDTFNGTERWLQIGVRPGNSTGSFTILSPRQKITPVPYAIHALSSGPGPGPGPMVGGSGTINYIPRWLTTTDLGDSIIYQDANTDNVGIGPGMTNPTERLDVSWSGGVNTRVGRYNYLGSCFSSATLVLGNNVRARTDSVNGIVVGQPHNVYGYRAITMSMNGIQFYGRTGTVSAGDPLDAATERMRITNEGNVGIGTTTPGRRLHVESAEDGQIKVKGTAPTGFGGLVLSNDEDDKFTGIVGVGGSSNPNADIVNSLFLSAPVDCDIVFQTVGRTRAIIDEGGNVGIGTNSPKQKLDVSQGNIILSEPGGTMRYIMLQRDGSNVGSMSTANGRITLGAESGYDAMVQNSSGDGIIVKNISGNVGIGTTDPGTYRLAVNGSAAKPGGGSWSNFSDRRLKELSGDYQRGLAEVSRLKPIRYTYAEHNELKLAAGRKFVGLVAQEVLDVIPEAVEENANGYLMVNNDPIIWAMVNAIKELKGQNQELRAQNVELTERLEALETIVQPYQSGLVKEVQP